MNLKTGTGSLVCLLVSILFSCHKEEPKISSALVVPMGFPEPTFPIDNEFSESRFQLGRKLFYDPILSRDSTISCASCHNPEFAYTDRQAVSKGVMGRMGTRNAPSLGNVAYHPYLLREGGVPTLEMQVGVPIQEHSEFDDNVILIAEKLNRQTIYKEMSLRAYNRLPDAFVIARAIANFERALLTGNSPYDKFIKGDFSALTNSAKNGFILFNKPEFKCNQCHFGFNFTNYAFVNNGLYEIYQDEGRKRLTGKEEDRSLFKVPSLRNVEITFPYMHDGSVSTLEEIVDHYALGGKNNLQKSSLITGFSITDQEKKDLVNFLKALTDHHFINNVNFRIQ